MKLTRLFNFKWCGLVAALLLLEAVTGCRENGPFVKPYSAVTKTGRVYNSPEECYLTAKALVESKGGKLSTPSDRVVEWKKTDLFWLFEFEHHSVVVFPLNWSERNYHFTFISGKVKGYDNLQDDLRPVFTPIKTGSAYSYPKIEMNSLIGPEYKVGIEGYYLGESWTRIDKLRHFHGSSGGGWTQETQQHASTACGNNFSLLFIENHLAYTSANREGSTRWGNIVVMGSLDSPKISVRLSGSIPLETNGFIKAVGGR